MKKILFCTLVISFICISSFSFGATFTLSVSGLPTPSLVEDVNILLSVDTNFVYTDSSNLLSTAGVLGSAIPAAPAGVLDWVWNPQPSVTGGLLSIAMFNGDVFDFGAGDGNYSQNNLLNGTIGQFDFEGTILGINSFTFSGIGGTPVPYSNLIEGNFSPNSAEFVVPIPGSILLLGSGLVGLIGLARRKRS